MKKNPKIDADGFTVHAGHNEIDLSFLDSKLDNSHEDNAFGLSPEFFAAQKRNDVDDFELLCDGVGD